jgi:enoyl-CoA hydratase/carnithine racemase
MNSEPILLERTGHVAHVVLNRPDRKNTFNSDMWQALAATIDTLRKELPRALVISGHPDGGFSAGFDVNPDNPQVAGVMNALEAGDRSTAEHLIAEIRSAIDELVGLPVPIIAAINGDAFGGGAELAVWCDMRIMDPKARICFSEVRLGLMPDWGGGVALTRLVGAAAAAELILTAEPIMAARALTMGLVNRVSESRTAPEEAMAMGARIAANGPGAVRHALAVIRGTRDLPLAEALDMESRHAVDLIMSGECIHGITAFLSGTPPEFPTPDDEHP